MPQYLWKSLYNNGQKLYLTQQFVLKIFWYAFLHLSRYQSHTNRIDHNLPIRKTNPLTKAIFTVSAIGHGLVNPFKLKRMKTFLRAFLSIAFVSLVSAQVYSQCDVSNIVIQNVTVAPSQGSGTCTVTFDASFTIENNNGNKFIFTHVWLQSDYPNYFRCNNGETTLNGAIRSPKSEDLADAFINLGINNNLPTPEIIMEYPPDSDVPMTTVQSISREVLPDGSAVFILTGITATVPVACGTPVVLVADLWSSQSAQAQVAHCVNCGIRYSAGYISVAGLVNCANLTFNAVLTNNTAEAITGTFEVHADINGDGYFTPAIDTAIQGETTFSIAAGVGMTTTVTGPVPLANRNQDLFIMVTQTSGEASGASRVLTLTSTLCAPLPVTFKSFKADRTNQSSVVLNWETLTEIDNRGFALQRNVRGTWEQVAFIPSQALDGNSSATLKYSFTDMNTHRGMSQYRIRQVDYDGRAKYSEIRAVRGDGQRSTTIVYPVPSTDGRVTVVFDNQEATRDVMLIDMNGRVLRQWKAVKNNTLSIENLRSGVYSLRINDIGNSNITVEKIIVTSN